MAKLAPRFLKRMSLQTAFLLAALSTLAIAAAFGFLGLSAVKQSTQRVLEERLLLAQTSAQHVDYILGEVLHQLQIALQSESVLLEDGPAARKLYDRLKQQISFFPYFVSLLDGEGTVLWSEPEVPGFKGVNLFGHPYVERTLQKGETAISEVVFGILPEHPLIFLAAPVRDRTGGIIGLVQIAVDPKISNMGEWVQPLSLGKTGYGQVVDKNGVVLASTEPDYLFQKAEHGPQFAALISRATTTMGSCHSCHEAPARRQDVLAFAPLSTASWGVAIQQSEGKPSPPLANSAASYFWLARQPFW